MSTLLQTLDTYHRKFYPHFSGSAHIWQFPWCHCWPYAVMTMKVIESVRLNECVSKYQCMSHDFGWVNRFLFVNLFFCNSSNIGQVFLIYDSTYARKFFNMIFLEKRQCWPWWNHCRRWTEYPFIKKLKVQFALDLDATWFVNLEKRLNIILLKWITWWTKIFIDVTKVHTFSWWFSWWS